jgi:hypothetical protein
MVRSLDELSQYPWTGHAGLLGKHLRTWQVTDEVLTHFGDSLRKARNGYRRFMTEGMDASGEDLSGGGLVRSYGGWENIKFLRKEHLTRVGDERILGDSNFVEAALKQDPGNFETRREAMRSRWQNR